MAKHKAVYCHFSFRRPKGKDYSLFATALYADKEGKVLVAANTRAYAMWKNHQHVTAIQAYEHALYCIWEWQYKLKEHGVTHVLLVTDNSTLAGWIEDPKKNKNYTAYMNRANEQYKVGGKKEIYLSIGICEVRDYEKSRKFCVEEKVSNKISVSKNTNSNISGGVKGSNQKNKLKIDEYKSIDDIINEDKPEGMLKDKTMNDINKYIID